MEVFKDYAYYYNAFYKDKDYKAEAAQIDGLLKKWGKNINSIVNFGCGTGRHDMELADLGHRCTGIDKSPMMIDIAKKAACTRKGEVDFFVGDIRDFSSEEKFDAVISLFHVMSYQKSNEDILHALQSARRVIRENGLLLFDVWYGPGVLSDKPCVRVREVEDEKNRLVRIAKPVMYDKENVVDVCYDVYVINKRSGETKEIREVHSMRYFFRPELEFLLKTAGFELIENLDCNTLCPTTYDSWTSYFIARAKV